MLTTFITLFIFGIIATAAVVFRLRGTNSKGQAELSSEMDKQADIIRKFDTAIIAGLTYVEPMTPLGEAIEREHSIAGLRGELATESAKLGTLDAQLSKLQKAVEDAEAAHNELKKGKEDAQTLADEIRGRKEQLAAEASRIASELIQSQAQLDLIAGEVTLTREQRSALNSVKAAVEGTNNQLMALNEIYSVAAARFTNLETQYSELEKEFTKLVEKELSGKFE